MLFESVSYLGELPFELSFLNVGEESKHCHKEIELVLVLRGVTHYQIYHMDYELNPGDLIIADVEDLHQIHDSSNDILLLSIHIDTRRFEHLYPDIRYMFFVCEECMEGPSGEKQLLQNKLDLLKQQISRLAFDYTRENPDAALLTEEINELVSILVTHFQGFFMEDYQYKTSQSGMSSEDLRRLCRVTRYIMLNYQKKISLDDVANLEHLSSYYMSHLIKENLGFNFQNFVNAIRLEFAEKLLVFSNMNLMHISQECGFSSPNYFNKCFSAWHGKTPAQYRKDYVPRERTFNRDFTLREALDLLSPYLHVSRRKEPVCLAPDFENGEFVDFWEGRAPRVVIDSLYSALILGFCWDELARIHPAAFLLMEKSSKRNPDLRRDLEELLNPFPIPLCEDRNSGGQELIQAENPARAARQILEEKKCRISLSGPKNSLFTTDRLSTFFYDIYLFFSELEDPQIQIHDSWVLVKSRHTCCVIVFNEDPISPRNVRLDLRHLPSQTIIIRREISGEETVPSVLAGREGKLAPLLKKRIKQQRRGRVEIETTADQAAGNLDFLLHPGAMATVEFLI